MLDVGCWALDVEISGGTTSVSSAVRPLRSNTFLPHQPGGTPAFAPLAKPFAPPALKFLPVEYEYEHEHRFTEHKFTPQYLHEIRRELC